MQTTLFLLQLIAAAATGDVPLRAGVARVEITPTVPMPMAGYPNRTCEVSAGVHDPLNAKVLVLSTGAAPIAIVTMDLGSFWSETLPRRVATELGIKTLLLATSHTHSAPLFLPGRSRIQVSAALKTRGAQYQRELEDKVFKAIKQAASSMFPARLSVARGSLQLGYNRLIMREDGRARVLYDNLDRVPYGPVDPEVTLLAVHDGAGATKALLVHYAAHAVVLGPTNCKFSADFPGVMQAKVEAQVPGSQVMFVQGGAGDVNPLFQGRSGDEQRDFAVSQTMGELLAAEVLRATGRLTPVPVQQPIKATTEALRFADRWEKGQSLDVAITTVLVGRDIAIAALPGEPMHRLQTFWKQHADVAYPLFFGYTYSGSGVWPGYIPDVHSAARGGYGADANTRIEVGAGERIMSRQLVNLYGLRGMWQDKPGRP